MAQMRVRRWSGGLVTALDPEQTSPGDFAILRNFVFDQDGLPITRGARRVWGDQIGADLTIRGIYHFKQGWVGKLPKDYILVYAGTKIFSAEFPLTAGAWTEIYDGLEEDLTPTWATLRGWAIFASNSESQRKPLFWSGVGEMMELENAPDCTMVATHAGRLWAVDQSNPSALNFSEPFAPNFWRVTQGAGTFFVSPGDGNVISALVPGFAGEMIIGKDGPSGGSIYRLSGLSADQFTISPLSTTIGIVSPYSVSMVGDRDIFFGSRRGLHSMRRVQEYGDLESANIDVEIRDIWRSLTNEQKRRAVVADDYPHDTWYVFYDSDGDLVNDSAILLNYGSRNERNNLLVSTVDYGASAAAIILEERSGTNVLMTGGSTGYVWTEGQQDPQDELVPDTLTDIEWEAQCAPILMEDPFAVCAFERLLIRHDCLGTGDVTVSWWADNQEPSSQTFPMNTNHFPTAFDGDTRAGQFRLGPISHTAQSAIHLRRGGTALHFNLTGYETRIRLRSFNLDYQEGRPNMTVGQWNPYKVGS